jgi:serine phosphatase RsbU (regulator of sigma subunit)
LKTNDLRQWRDLSFLQAELENFLENATQFNPSPGELPKLEGLSIFGETRNLFGVLGGDHLIYLDFKQRYDLEKRIREAERDKRHHVAQELKNNRQRAGILIADVSGHRMTDAFLSAMLHQAFLTGVLYELDNHGTITPQLFENLNNRFYRTRSTNKYITMLYGEIHENGRFRFISAGHPLPALFSMQHRDVVTIHPELMTRFPPIGTIPSKMDPDRSKEHTVLGWKENYKVFEIKSLKPGDVLFLFTDGFLEHGEDRGDKDALPPALETLSSLCRSYPDRCAQELVPMVLDELARWGPFRDDVTLLAIKRNNPDQRQVAPPGILPGVGD